MSVFALSILFEEISQRFNDENTTAQMVFGWREPTKQINQGVGRANRVVFEPGVAGKAGTYMAARNPGRNPRPLRTLVENATIYCWGFDASAPNDERLQYEAARLLHDAVIRAIHLSENVGHGTFQISDPQWVVDKTERRFGAELKFTLQLQSMIPDTPYPEANPPGQLDNTNIFNGANGDLIESVDVIEIGA